MIELKDFINEKAKSLFFHSKNGEVELKPQDKDLEYSADVLLGGKKVGEYVYNPSTKGYYFYPEKYLSPNVVPSGWDTRREMVDYISKIKL